MQHTRLRGLNFGGWMSQIDAIMEKDPAAFPGVDEHLQRFIDESDFAQLKSWGFNHVRLPIDALHFFDDTEHPIECRLQVLDRAVAQAAKNDLRCILDLHECPGHDFADATTVPVQKLFTDNRYVDKAVTIWSVLAERYSTHPHVLFEPLNEPVAPDAETWNTIKAPLCSAIRTHAPKNHIIVGSNMWNWPSTFPDLTPVDMDNIIYNFHFYEPLLFTHQRAPWMHEPEIKADYSYPGNYGRGFTRKFGLVHAEGIWNRDRFYREILPVVEFGKKHSAEVTCNEFGVYAPVPIELQLLWLDDFLSVLKEFEIGFSYWNYKNLDFGIISRGEQLHADRPQYANPEKTNYQVLSVLQKY